MAKNEKTSKTVATKASKLLRNPKTPEDVKSIAGSALKQVSNKSLPPVELTPKIPPVKPPKKKM